ncbi:MAG: cytochrome c biogenesis protein ResB [Alphaproteobacteria bacterium]|nr:cytochrome c biogenesis protein ResB [Alphaproteobacteria bacterium]
MIQTIRNYGLILARPGPVFYILMWLMVLLVAGTVAQKYIGLYRAQDLFFSSYILWLGPVPLPGGIVTLGAFTVSLLAKMIFASPWTWRNAGSLVTHAGALLLLLGGLLTFVHAEEGNMVIYEGESADFYSSYHDRELVVEDQETGGKVASFAWKDLAPGAALPLPEVKGLRLQAVKFCRNCAFVPRTEKEDDPALAELRGRARNFDITPAPLEKEDESNRSAIQFRVSGADDKDEDGIHFSTDFIDVSPAITVGGKTYNIALRKVRTALPFSIKLVNFEKEVYPGTNTPKSYQSEVVLKEGKTEWHSLIRMNEPLRYRGYTFYQSSFIDSGENEATVLAVVKNAGRMFPYIASIVMCIGLLIHMAMYLPSLIRRMGGAAKVVVFAAMLGAMVSGGAGFARAADALDYAAFSRMPVLDQGRVKPLDTFARSYLETFNGRDSLQGMDAPAWLAEMMFNPGEGYNRPVFNIANPAVVDAMELERRPGHRYSYREVATSFAVHYKDWQDLLGAPESELTLAQRQLSELFDKIRLYADISRTLSLTFPDFTVPEGPLAKAFGVEPGTVMSYMQLRGYRDAIAVIVEPVFAKSEDETLELTPQEQAVIDFSLKFNQIGRDRMSKTLLLIPPQWHEKSGMADGKTANLWYSPWNITFFGQGSPESEQYLETWGKAVQAYRDKDAEGWATLTGEIDGMALKMAGDKVSPKMLDLEVYFNNWKPFEISLAFYLGAFLAVMASLLICPVWLRRVSFGLLLAGLAFHMAGIGVRMAIMERPPVSNLYESIVFVGFIVVLVGSFLEARLKNRMGLIIASSIGVLLHFLGIRFDADGDTMGMLVAVLNTNFWLATHVVTITTGYGICLVAGVIGHIYLVRRFFRPRDEEALRALYRNMQGVVYVALFFGALGTILGGIWADQSWGRFWGWDPKENGALLIVLWLVWLLHGKLSGKMGALGFSAGLACTNIIVAMAWFGVNLLSVGLHSYGFTQNAAATFIGFCGIELVVVLGLYAAIRVKEAGKGEALA